MKSPARTAMLILLLQSLAAALGASICFAQVYQNEFGSTGAGNGQFNTPVGIAIDASDNVYVVDTGNNRVQVFDSAGVYQSQFGTAGAGNGQFSSPRSIAIDSAGNIFVTDFGNNRVQRFDSAGVYQGQWGTAGLAAGQFNGPHGIATDSAGGVYVADTGNNRVQKFTGATGALIFAWGTAGSANGQFTTPFAVAVDASDRVYVSDSTGRIQRFDATGLSATYLSTWGGSGRSDGQFLGIRGIDVDPSGNLFATDFSNSRVQQLDSSGSYLVKWGIFGPSAGMFDAPAGVAVNSAGTIYVVDSNNDRVQLFVAPQPATYDATGTWNFLWTNKRTLAQVGIVCTASADSTATMTISQTGDLVTATVLNASYSGFVSGSTYNISRASTEFGTFDYSEEFILTLTSASSGAGNSYSGVTDNAGTYCLGDGVVTIPSQVTGGGGESSGGGGGGGGGCFINSIF